MSNMDWHCPYCLGEGEISYGRSEEPVYVICSNCSRGDAYVWCEKCGEGGQIATNDFNSRPSEWKCRICGREYKLPKKLYEYPITFAPVAFSADILGCLPPSKKFANVSPVLLRKFLIYWNSYRERVAITVMLLFVAIIVLRMLDQPIQRVFPLFREYSSNLILFVIFCFFAIPVLDIVSWILEKIVLWNTKHRLRKMK